RVLAVGITAVIIAMAIAGTQTDPIAFLAGLGDAPRTLAMFLPPSDGAMGIRLLEALLVTVQIGLAATLIGVVLAVPIGALAARNVAPNRTCAMVFRTIIVAVRAFPELILAIIFIVIIGLGPQPGTLALGIGS